VDPQTILWTDTEVYQRGYEKTATALIAVERALRSRCPLGGAEDEFLSLYETLAAADPETFTVIWEDPFAYFWARWAYELTGWCLNPAPPPAALIRYCAQLGADEPHRALALHLEEFKKFILALELRSGGARGFQRPLRTLLPFSIPGTRLSLLGSGAIEILGVGEQGLQVMRDGRSWHLAIGSAPATRDIAALVERPVARFGDFEDTLKPETFMVPGINEARRLADLPDSYQQQQVSLLQEALALVERHQPTAFEHFTHLTRVIAFKSPTEGSFSNVSFSDLPGAFILSAVPEPHWVADALIHELLHNRLYFILERGEILDRSEGDEPTEFYSPWREDLRPLSGLLHANYVYIGVARFWHAVCASGEARGLERAYAEDQAVRAVLQLKIGIAQMGRHAKFTSRGFELFRQMEREADDLLASMRRLHLSPDAPATVARSDGALVGIVSKADGRPLSILESVEAHVAEFDIHRQCPRLRAMFHLA